MSARDVMVTVTNFGARSEDYLRGFEEGIAAYRAALRAASYVVVPREPTAEMIAAGWIDKEDVNPDDIYRAMLAASEATP